MTQLARGERNGCNIIPLPIYAKVAISWVFAASVLHIRDRINKFD